MAQNLKNFLNRRNFSPPMGILIVVVVLVVLVVVINNKLVQLVAAWAVLTKGKFS
jgi:hypothetical protein